MKPSRENILNRIRAALRVEGSRPMQPTGAAIWPPVGDDLEKRFRAEFDALKGELLESADALRSFLAGKSVCGLDTLRGMTGAAVDGIDEASLMQAEVGVTGCDCLVAQTGSIVITVRSAGGRALSVFPPIHLVVARRDQMVADLDAAMCVLGDRYAGNWPSQISVVTGPSRTSDIEKVLVLGAHGPKRLALYLV